MGQPRKKSGIVVVALLLVTALLVFGKAETIAVKKQLPLNDALSHISGWEKTNPIFLDGEIVAELALDDYIYQGYQNNGMTISLYIGYYLTNGKIGAAHDPLVCFPGQGWVLSNKTSSTLPLTGVISESIQYSSMQAERGGQKEILLYWFQAYDKALATTQSQKIASFWGKIWGKGEDSAFVRLGCSVHENDAASCKEGLKLFARDLYPVFLKYIYDTDIPSTGDSVQHVD